MKCATFVAAAIIASASALPVEHGIEKWLSSNAVDPYIPNSYVGLVTRQEIIKRDLDAAIASVLERRKGGGGGGEKPAAEKPSAPEPHKPAPPAPVPEKTADPSHSSAGHTHEWHIDGPTISLPPIDFGGSSTTTTTAVVPGATPAPGP